MKVKLNLAMSLLLVFVMLSCQKSSKITYENQQTLESIIKSRINYNLNENDKNSVVIILQNIDCICTKEDMQLAKDIILSSKYARYNFILILKGEKHLFLKELPDERIKDLKIITDNNDSFLKDGYISTTDRIIIYENGQSVIYEDMHKTKPEKIGKMLLNT